MPLGHIQLTGWGLPSTAGAHRTCQVSGTPNRTGAAWRGSAGRRAQGAQPLLRAEVPSLSQKQQRSQKESFSAATFGLCALRVHTGAPRRAPAFWGKPVR